MLSKANYVLHTDAIKNNIIPKVTFGSLRQAWIYADEADVLNLTVFGCTAKMWRKANKELAKKRFNIRDTASINQLVVLANMESYKSQLIKDGFTKDDRKRMLHKAAKEQLRVLNENNALRNGDVLKNAGAVIPNVGVAAPFVINVFEIWAMTRNADMSAW